MSQKPRAVVIDIDNCWMDSRAIPQFAEEDLDVYAELLKNHCIPNRKFINDVVEFIKENELYPIFVTGRTGTPKILNITENQIEDNFIDFEDYGLWMREMDDMTPTPLMKTKIIQRLIERYTIIAAIDDDQRNLDEFSRHFSFDCYRYNIADDIIYKVKSHA